jgi:hypothetical protein
VAAFAGASFAERGHDWQQLAATAQSSSQALVGSGSLLLLSGQIERSATIAALVTGEELVGLRSLVGTVGTLELGAGSYGDVLLAAVASPAELAPCAVYEVDLDVIAGINAVQTLECTVLIGGAPVRNVINVQTSYGRSQGISTATVNCLGGSGGAEGEDVEIYVSLNGAPASAIYKGRVEQYSWDFYPGVRTIECRGRLARLAMPWGAEIERVYAQSLGNGDDAVIIRNLIEAWGIPSSLHDIESSGWELGQINELVVRKGDKFLDLIQRMDTIAGYATFDLHDGAIYRRAQDPFGSGGASEGTFTEGENILSVRRRQDTSSIINHAIVEGFAYEGVEIKQEYKESSGILDAFAGIAGPTYRATTLKDDLIETETHALETATRLVRYGNTRADTLELTVLFEPTLSVGLTVTVDAPSVNAGGVRVVIEEIKHALSGPQALTTIVTNTGELG